MQSFKESEHKRWSWAWSEFGLSRNFQSWRESDCLLFLSALEAISGWATKDLNKRWHPLFAQRLSGRYLRPPTSRSDCEEIRQRLSSSTNSRSTRGSIAWRGGRKVAVKATWRHPKAPLAWPSFEPYLNLKFMGS